jgi:hypothetical protein
MTELIPSPGRECRVSYGSGADEALLYSTATHCSDIERQAGQCSLLLLQRHLDDRYRGASDIAEQWDELGFKSRSMSSEGGKPGEKMAAPIGPGDWPRGVSSTAHPYVTLLLLQFDRI